MLVFRWASVAPFTPFSLIQPLFISLTFFISTLRQDSSAPPLTQEFYAFRRNSIFLCRSSCLEILCLVKLDIQTTAFKMAMKTHLFKSYLC